MRQAGLSLAFLLAGCGGVDPASGLTAYMRASNAQYEPGELTDEPRADKPTVDQIKSNNTRIFPGARGRSIGGDVSGTATAILIGLAGDSAHWLIPVGVADLEMPSDFTFATSLSFSPTLPAGARALVFRAVDAHGEVGPAQALTLKVDAATPVGALVIQLSWDTEADLDLHVRIPNPSDAKTPHFDAWNRAPRALPPRPSDQPAYTPAELDAGGRLLFDSNAACTIDGQRHEEIVFPGALPPGPYEVRVDTSSLCGEPTARWRVAIFRNDQGAEAVETLAEAFGQSIERDTLATHAAQSGVLALTFTP